MIGAESLLVAQLEARSVVADGLARQHLHDDALAADVVQVARDLVGLHATGAPNPYLQLLARMVGFERSMLDRELYERRTLVRARCMRGTLFILPLDLLPIAWAATRSRVLDASSAYLASQGLTPASYEQWLGGSRPCSPGRPCLRRRCARRCTLVGRFRSPPCSTRCVTRGGCCATGQWQGGVTLTTPIAFSRVLPQVHLDRWDPAEATTQLVERYIARYGPVTLDDIAWWTGLSVSRCRTALAELDDRVMPVRVPGWDGEYVIVRADLDRLLRPTAPAARQLSLLANLDPYTMGFHQRARMVDAARREFVYDRGGNATSVVLFDGRLVGVWDVLAHQGEARFFLFANPTDAMDDRLRAELAAVGAFITGSAVTVMRLDRMTPLTERRAGWMLKPLHD